MVTAAKVRTMGSRGHSRQESAPGRREDGSPLTDTRCKRLHLRLLPLRIRTVKSTKDEDKVYIVRVGHRFNVTDLVIVGKNALPEVMGTIGRAAMTLLCCTDED